jgi:acyl dehydratase/NAD(P)-dependent dehydrogenase (short-subunit alcohol dehydrogenase family)
VDEASFEVEVLPEHAAAFAALSGDWNPLHTDAEYAATSQYGRPILHGAFSAGLLSRMAGMYLPGTDCLLHAIELRFLRPIFLPSTLLVKGTLASESDDAGKVQVTIVDARTGVSLVAGSYAFGRHKARSAEPTPKPRFTDAPAVTLITGAGGALGTALAQRLAGTAIGVSSSELVGKTLDEQAHLLSTAVGDRAISAIVHCGWPSPDNTRLTRLENVNAAVDYHLSDPLRQAIGFARILSTEGTDDAILLLLGSTAGEPGRHNFRSPLYSLSKSMLPLLTRILAVELGATGRRCANVMFDVIDAGMNAAMTKQARVAHESRSPAMRIPSVSDAADQLAWILDNRSSLLSGATISLSGGALP